MKKNSKGFALITAVFLLVVLALLGTFIVRVYGVTSRTSSLAIQGVRAYYAALSGLNWAAYQAVANSSCSASTVVSMTQVGLSGYSATVQCTALVTAEGTIYTITSQGFRGTVGTLDYISRTITGTVVQ